MARLVGGQRVLHFLILLAVAFALFICNELIVRDIYDRNAQADWVIPPNRWQMKATESKAESKEVYDTMNGSSEREWQCGKSQPHCDRTKFQNDYHRQVARVFMGRNAALSRRRAGMECSCHMFWHDPEYAYDHSCCQRVIIGVHKMGIAMAQDLLKHQKENHYIHIPVPTTEIMSDHISGRSFEYEYLDPFSVFVADYRHVVVTRDWYDSIVSGYLYHKAGKECSLDWYGKPWSSGWLYNNSDEDWEIRLNHPYRGLLGTNHVTSSLPIIQFHNHRWKWRPGNGRDLCKYLADESEEDGLRVYAAWAMLIFFYPLWEFRRHRLQSEQNPHGQPKRTLFLCFENLVSSSNSTTNTTIQLFQWLYGPTYRKDHKSSVAQRNSSMIGKKNYDQGLHASDQDQVLRQRLRHMISVVDDELFLGTIRKGSNEFGCSRSMLRS